MQLVWELLETIWITYKCFKYDTRLVFIWTPSSTTCFNSHWLPQRTPQLPLVTFEYLCRNCKHVVSNLGLIIGIAERQVSRLGVVTLHPQTGSYQITKDPSTKPKTWVLYKGCFPPQISKDTNKFHVLWIELSLWSLPWSTLWNLFRL
jgi:hypothetical protein